MPDLLAASSITTEASTSTLETLLLRDRAVIAAGIGGITAISWSYLYQEVQSNHCVRMAEMAMPHMQSWTLTEFSLMFMMWTVMMIGMMTPSAAPMVLTFARVSHNRRMRERPYVPASIFLAGYLTVWTLFSLAATLAQWGFHASALLSPAMVATSRWLGGGLLIAAGIFQWSPLKRACLTHCRTPFHFIMMHWREGGWGAFRMGIHHGAHCVGCCWLLMCLLFVAGVMNLAWVAAISAFVLLEKIAPRPILVNRLTGAIMIAAGIWMVSS